MSAMKRRHELDYDGEYQDVGYRELKPGNMPTSEGTCESLSWGYANIKVKSCSHKLSIHY
jgi:hypothetical protein